MKAEIILILAVLIVLLFTFVGFRYLEIRLQRSRYLEEENKFLKFKYKRYEKICDVLNTGAAGGLEKRVSENVEVASILLSHYPEIIKAHPTIGWTLCANDEFMQELFYAECDDGHPARLQDYRRPVFVHIEHLARGGDAAQTG